MRFMWRCLVGSIPNPIASAVFLNATLSYWTFVCKMIDDSVSAILALCDYVGFDGLSLRSNAVLRKHDAWACMVWLMTSNVKCAIIWS